MSSQVRVSREPVVIPTYPEQPADRNPMFLETRVYQGSSGKVYPLPFTDRVSDVREDKTWDAVYLENEFIRLMMLPEIGGRIHAGEDKINGYDFFYRQNVIKPALVGLAGPWISGGVEFNWPQHHRPATYLPVDVEIEEHPDGSKTVWFSDHDPMSRMKGMHGVCLRPGKACVEVKVRLYNRTPFVQTFLWWANVAARVNSHYQSFFPPDVSHVADHAKRATSTFPLCSGSYYGVDYAARAERNEHNAGGTQPPSAPNDLSWYWNIPVPTSYMCMGTDGEFFGGYDHGREAGLVHVANHHIAPGKKQWTWGNHEFGYSWDRQLTDEDGPYIELMAGVYTDNQPDFSFLQPGETKTFSQFWYPIRKIGIPQKANVAAAVSLNVTDGRATIGVCVTSVVSGVAVKLCSNDTVLWQQHGDFAPEKPLLETVEIPAGLAAAEVTFSMVASDGSEIISHTPPKRENAEPPSPATEPPQPSEIVSNDELYITGLHLEQYRHATRRPGIYWEEALRRDPLDARCNNAIGLQHLKRGDFAVAEKHFRNALKRLVSRNPNPYDGEPYYNLGLALRYQNREREAYAAFYKACWNQPWQAAGYYSLAELDCKRGDWNAALDHLDGSLRVNVDNLRARALKVLVLRKMGRDQEADTLLRETLSLDPLDMWARHLAGQFPGCDVQTCLDIALDYARAGFFEEARAILDDCLSHGAKRSRGAVPLLHYYRGFFEHQLGREKEALACLADASNATPDYCFPARLEEIEILETAMAANPGDSRAAYYLGNLLYDKGRHNEAIQLWEASAKLDPSFSVVWRNLGIAYYNDTGDAAAARDAYLHAIQAGPSDARLVYEQDQLWKKMGVPPAERLAVLETKIDMVAQRDDLTVELAALYNQTMQPEKARDLFSKRNFHPWEGGEGEVLGQYVRTYLILGRQALAGGDFTEACRMFESALRPPVNLGESPHLLANRGDIHFWLGEACAAAGDQDGATQWWKQAAEFSGDFQAMSVKVHSEMTFYKALALARLGCRKEAGELLEQLLRYAEELFVTEAKIDYFATSLPAMLLFRDDLRQRQRVTATFLLAQAKLGLGDKAQARELLGKVLEADPGHAAAFDTRALLERFPLP